MKNLHQAQDLVRHNKYQEAFELLNKLFLDDSVSRSIRIEALELIIKTQSLLGKEKSSTKYFVHCAGLLTEEGLYERAFKYYEKVSEELKGDEYLRAWKVGYKTGQIFKAELHALEYIHFLLEKKNIGKCLTFLDELKGQGALKGKVESLMLEASLKAGREEILNQKFNKILENYLTGKIGKEIDLMESIQETIEENELYWNRQPKIREMELIKNLNLITKSPSDWELRKQFINNLFEHLLAEPHNCLTHLLLLRYAFTVKRKTLFAITTDFIMSNGDLFKGSESIVDLATKGNAKIDQMDDDPESEDEDLDMATDLFETEQGNAGQIHEIQKLERDIHFLKKQGRDVEALELMRELRNIDEEHSMVKELHELESSEQGSSIIKKELKIEEVEKNLLRDISKYVGDMDTFTEKDRIGSEGVFSTMVAYLDKGILERNYADLVVSFITFDMPQVALNILESIDTDSLSLSGKINNQYLKVQALIKQSKVHVALDEVISVLTEQPLIKEEKVCFLYLKAELLRDLGRTREAFLIYREVKGINPKYRMLEERMKEFE